MAIINGVEMIITNNLIMLILKSAIMKKLIRVTL